MVDALLVDDDVAILESMKSLAQSAGHVLLTAQNWDEGFALFQIFYPNLVIADYNMPGSRHGLQLLFEACRIRPSTRLLLISAYLNEDDVQKVRDLGLVDEVLRKVEPLATSRALMDEIQASAARSSQAVNWQKVAAATKAASSVDEEKLKEMDRFLRAERLREGSPRRSA